MSKQFGDINHALSALYGPAIEKQHAEADRMFRDLFPQTGLAPLYGPPAPMLLVRDLIKLLSACDPDAYVYTEDYEIGPQSAYQVVNSETYVTIR